MNTSLVQYLEDNIFGQYQPIYVIDQATGEVLDSSIDWGYICCVAVFLLILYMVFRCIGGVIRGLCSK